ncbi:MAG: polysaccharide deacetylase family protein [Enterococcus lacertideformus]|uniref:Polysaccharide deacetylase family protein n=1 Tax=Enterococcus lacertideformus TaxID=2771493 RepID=A0A931AXI3_9ENTE|nr:polysaccharide deacetylase family protein [Enterococcus lacertideformus]
MKGFCKRVINISILLVILFSGISLVIVKIEKESTDRGFKGNEKVIRNKESKWTKSSALLMDKQTMEKIAPGMNHNIEARRYAHETKKIKRYINNEEKYDGHPLVFLTFDDGIHLTMTPKILDILKENQVPATFFILGSKVNDQTQQMLKRQLTEGHAIALHGYSHDYNLLYPNGHASVPQIEREFIKNKEILNNYLGKEFVSKVWRYPGGHMSWEGLTNADHLLDRSSVQWIDWNASVGDASPLEERPTTIDEMMNYLEASYKTSTNQQVQVVLMHDGLDQSLTSEALPKVINFYKEKGYHFGILS